MKEGTGQYQYRLLVGENEGKEAPRDLNAVISLRRIFSVLMTQLTHETQHLLLSSGHSAYLFSAY